MAKGSLADGTYAFEISIRIESFFCRMDRSTIIVCRRNEIEAPIDGLRISSVEAVVSSFFSDGSLRHRTKGWIEVGFVQCCGSWEGIHCSRERFSMLSRGRAEVLTIEHLDWWSCVYSSFTLKRRVKGKCESEEELKEDIDNDHWRNERREYLRLKSEQSNQWSEFLRYSACT